MRTHSSFVHPTCLLLLLAFSARGHSDEWPTYQQNVHRNAVTAAVFSLEEVPRLRLHWRWAGLDPPQPAWFGPAKWDAYSELRGLKSMRNYDNVFHVVAGNGHVYFGSSIDDSVHRLYADNGQTQWLFTTDAPVRVPPTLWQDKLYFGSDDGYAYCIGASDGELIWKYRPSPDDEQILHDGRLISKWPCRSGVAVDDGVAYFAASLLPWNDGYLCAVDAETGKQLDNRHFSQAIQQATMEGPLALSDLNIIVPRGRVAPMIYARRDGAELGPLQGGGGSFVVLGRNQVFHGPGNKSGWLTGSNASSRDVVATLKGARALVIDGSINYLLAADELVASDMSTRDVLWRATTNQLDALIKVGQVLFLGGDQRVEAREAATGKLIWKHDVEGTAYGLAAAGGRLFASTSKGIVYAFAAGPDERSAVDATETDTEQPETKRPQPEQAEAEQPDTEQPEAEQPPPARQLVHEGLVAIGPWLRFLTPSAASIEWQTTDPVTGSVEIEQQGQRRVLVEPAARREHRVTVDELPHRGALRYRIGRRDGGATRTTDWIDVDTLFNFTRAEPLREQAAGQTDRVETLLKFAGEKPGICVLLGMEDTALAFELLRHSQLRIIGFDTRQEVVDAARRAAVDHGVYGVRFSCQLVSQLDRLPVVGDFANLVSGAEEAWTPSVWREAARLAQPAGKVVLALDAEDRTLAGGNELERCQVERMEISGRAWCVATRVQPSGTGQWTHVYGTSGNALYDGEQLAGAARSDAFRVQWIGRPGPRFQPDRNGRKPPPVSAGGKLFVQGLQRIAAIDQYNGTILWSLEIPGLARFNMPRDCGNWCADSRQVYLAMGDRCWTIGADTGEVRCDLRVPDHPHDWGYVARVRNLLLGSAVRTGSSWRSFWGKQGWYDAEQGPVTHQVCSDALFAYDLASRERSWEYSQGLILNATIAASDERVYFLECRDPAVLGGAGRRVAADALWKDLYLVALDTATGLPKAERKLDGMPGRVACYLAHGSEHLVLVASANRQYSVSAFRDTNCELVWQQSFAWGKGRADHGSHLSRPAIVGTRVFVRPKVFDLRSGAPSELSIPVAGCGTYAATDFALFFRAGSGKNSAVWSTSDGDYTTWSRLRPDCWLSTIPAGGMLLSPEGGGGCSCGSWLETSIGFMPSPAQVRAAAAPK